MPLPTAPHHPRFHDFRLKFASLMYFVYIKRISGESLSRVGILPRRFGSRFVPVGAGEGLCGVGTLASPWQEGESVHRSRTRATQASPPHVHTTPAPTNVTICPQKADP